MALSKSKLFFVFLALVLLASGFFLYNAYSLTKATNQETEEKQLLLQQYESLPPTGKTLFYQQSEGLSKPVDPRIVALDNLSISCADGENVLSLSEKNSFLGGSCVGPGMALDFEDNGKAEKNLGGQCCGALTDYSKVEKQIEALKKYSFIPDLPANHYDTPVELAKKWISFDKQTKLTPEQQKVYDEAMRISEEGPCCCACWHWYVNSGIAKKMIVDYNFNAEQIAEYWDASDICS